MTTRICDESCNGQTVDLAVGENIEIRLRENPTTGFRWQVTGNDRAVCTMTSDAFNREAGPPGHGGEHSWVFEAVRPGECDIEFRYQRPWADPASPGQIFRIHIQVQN
jgi:inhibitor of cysteine peptidase